MRSGKFAAIFSLLFSIGCSVFDIRFMCLISDIYYCDFSFFFFFFYEFWNMREILLGILESIKNIWSMYAYSRNAIGNIFSLVDTFSMVLIEWTNKSVFDSQYIHYHTVHSSLYQNNFTIYLHQVKRRFNVYLYTYTFIRILSAM